MIHHYFAINSILDAKTSKVHQNVLRKIMTLSQSCIKNIISGMIANAHIYKLLTLDKGIHTLKKKSNTSTYSGGYYTQSSAD